MVAHGLASILLPQVPFRHLAIQTGTEGSVAAIGSGTNVPCPFYRKARQSEAALVKEIYRTNILPTLLHASGQLLVRPSITCLFYSVHRFTTD